MMFLIFFGFVVVVSVDVFCFVIVDVIPTFVVVGVVVVVVVSQQSKEERESNIECCCLNGPCTKTSPIRHSFKLFHWFWCCCYHCCCCCCCCSRCCFFVAVF